MLGGDRPDVGDSHKTWRSVAGDEPNMGGVLGSICFGKAEITRPAFEGPVKHSPPAPQPSNPVSRRSTTSEPTPPAPGSPDSGSSQCPKCQLLEPSENSTSIRVGPWILGTSTVHQLPVLRYKFWKVPIWIPLSIPVVVAVKRGWDYFVAKLP